MTQSTARFVLLGLGLVAIVGTAVAESIGVLVGAGAALGVVALVYPRVAHQYTRPEAISLDATGTQWLGVGLAFLSIGLGVLKDWSAIDPTASADRAALLLIPFGLLLALSGLTFASMARRADRVGRWQHRGLRGVSVKCPKCRELVAVPLGAYDLKPPNDWVERESCSCHICTAARTPSGVADIKTVAAAKTRADQHADEAAVAAERLERSVRAALLAGVRADELAITLDWPTARVESLR